METVVVVLMTLATLSFSVKVSLMKTWQVVLFAALCGLFVASAWPYAIEQSRLQISAWLADCSLMRDVAVALTFDVGCQVAYCLLAARIFVVGHVGRRLLLAHRIMMFFPGVLMFGVLFFALVSAENAFAGVSFATTAYVLALVLALVLLFAALGVRSLLPEVDIRLELLFLCNALILALGVVATVNGATAFHGSDAIEWGALGAFLGLAVVCGAIGYFRSVSRGRKCVN